MERNRPTEITAERETKTLTVRWSNGQTCRYPYALLRKACPCAVCKGEQGENQPAGDGLEIPLIDPRETLIRKIELVGNYAMNIEWEDGHQFGIYQWDYLLSLCPQEEPESA